MDRPGIKNWHWRTKGCESWAKDWFRKELIGVEAEGVRIDSVKDVEGDCEVGMRKSKLVTIYDQKITMLWRAGEGDESVTGSLTVHEVAHDMDEDDYVFTSTLDSAATKQSDAFNTIARKALANKLRPIFQRFPADLIEAHGRDLLSDVDGGSGAGSGASTPATATASSSATASQSKPTVPLGSSVSIRQGKSGQSFNTAVVKAEGEFMCDAATLWEFLTNEQKIPLWSRNPAKFRPEVGAEVELFGRNITGKVEDVKAPTSITTSWRAPTWPEGYFGTLETTLHQGSASTTLTLRLSGVPVGKEDEAERNLTSYYINSLKQIGFVFESLPFTPLPSTSTQSAAPKALNPSQARARARARPGVTKPSPWVMVGNISAVLVSVGIVAALAAGIYYGPSGPGGRKA
ncbi:BQ5605_C005g03642 [Microbotryum silenes-dioicae]|uniref:BQ5605_C005g03642 protein n=1 Tax=Microbotryum silenes-dioicae TaxID=796604 RepID=A0A2X0MBI0_9BASI|nr:BQ5605_C005g03642 [Microbotryum silenes-dioicae]